MNNYITKLSNQLTECVLAIQQRDIHIQQLGQLVNQQNKKIQELNERIERNEKGTNQRSNSQSQLSMTKPKRLLNLSFDWRRASTKYRK
jgi:predicted  nucleic acid-binding Zn-ribbon protein